MVVLHIFDSTPSLISLSYAEVLHFMSKSFVRFFSKADPKAGHEEPKSIIFAVPF